MPHLHVVSKVLDLLRQREDEQVADLPKVGRIARLLFEAFKQLHRHALQADVGLYRELLADTARASAGGLRAERLAFEEQHVNLAPGPLIRKRAAHDAAAHD